MAVPFFSEPRPGVEKRPPTSPVRRKTHLNNGLDRGTFRVTSPKRPHTPPRGSRRSVPNTDAAWLTFTGRAGHDSRRPNDFHPAVSPAP